MVGYKYSQGMPINVFISYSHLDELRYEQLVKHLKPLEYEGIIRAWHDLKINPGREFDADIWAELNVADIILLLVSPDFLASDYCWGKEVKRAMERHQAKDARVIPVILRPVDWRQCPFGKLVSLPKDGKPVSSWQDEDEALLNIATGIRSVAAELKIAAVRNVKDTRILEDGRRLASPDILASVSKARPYAALAALAILISAAVWLAGVYFSRLHDTMSPKVLPESRLTYYFSVRKPNSQEWVRYGREMITPAGYFLRFYFSSPQSGHLYLLNEGPVPRGKMASFNILFPTPTTNQGSSLLNANQTLQFPHDDTLRLDADQGIEKLYIIWSAQEIAQIEQLKQWENRRDAGAVQSLADVSKIQEFLQKNPPMARADELESSTALIQKGDPLVYMVKLAHQ